jgi:hypothetical protein
MELEYKGFVIRYSEWDDEFSCDFKGDETSHGQSVKALVKFE